VESSRPTFTSRRKELYRQMSGYIHPALLHSPKAIPQIASRYPPAGKDGTHRLARTKDRFAANATLTITGRLLVLLYILD
jgi:hypothetical protein